MLLCTFIQHHHDPKGNFDSDAVSDADADANSEDISDVFAHAKAHAADVDAGR